MPTITIDIARGLPVPDLSALDAPACLARKRELEQGLVATRGDPARLAERKALVAENEAIDKRLRELKEVAKAENMRRNFAGIGSPLHEACVACLAPDVVAELEAEAVKRQGERERRAAERRAAKAGESK